MHVLPERVIFVTLIIVILILRCNLILKYIKEGKDGKIHEKGFPDFIPHTYKRPKVTHIGRKIGFQSIKEIQMHNNRA